MKISDADAPSFLTKELTRERAEFTGHKNVNESGLSCHGILAAGL